MYFSDTCLKPALYILIHKCLKNFPDTLEIQNTNHKYVCMILEDDLQKYDYYEMNAIKHIKV